MMKKDEILEGVLEEFGKLAAIPRKSGHEKAVSDFLKGYLEALGLQVTQDEVCNIIAELPASPGYEEKPLVILQGHMDMVCVAEPGYAYDPLQDPIKLRRTEEYLEAEGTSLGADDGVGVAEIIYIVKTLRNHGPLRVIVTVDEEQGMSGAIHLDERYLADAAYLINCDSENYDELTIGSAGGASIDFLRQMRRVPAASKRGWLVHASGFKGGHSGERIGDGLGNAIRSLASVLRALQKRGTVELASLDGGKARNVIPTAAEACIATELSEAELRDILSEQAEIVRQTYGKSESAAGFSLRETELPQQVFATEDALALLRLLGILHSGVYAMSQAVPSMVETSANIGVVSTEGDLVSVRCMPRSSNDRKLEAFCSMAEDLAALTGFDVNIDMVSPAWKERADSILAKLMAEIFLQQNGKKMKVCAIHAGLECGWHLKKNPALDLVSIGVTTQDIHSPRERLLLSTVRPQVELILETLRRIAEGLLPDVPIGEVEVDSDEKSHADEK